VLRVCPKFLIPVHAAPPLLLLLLLFAAGCLCCCWLYRFPVHAIDLHTAAETQGGAHGATASSTTWLNTAAEEHMTARWPCVMSFRSVVAGTIFSYRAYHI